MDDAERWLDAIAIVPETLLRRARAAESGTERGHYARLGLSLEPLDSDTELHLLRQLYRSQLELSELQEAIDTARKMTTHDTLRDVSHHDVSRVLSAIGDAEAAIWQQRAAARFAPPERRSFHLWSLGTLQHFAGQNPAALSTLDRALRWAARDRALIEAHQAYIHLANGQPPGNLDGVIERLSRDGLQGYRLYLRGMIAFHQGSEIVAQLFLSRWLDRHDEADVLRTLTLHEELRRARNALASLCER